MMKCNAAAAVAMVLGLASGAHSQPPATNSSNSSEDSLRAAEGLQRSVVALKNGLAEQTEKLKGLQDRLANLEKYDAVAAEKVRETTEVIRVLSERLELLEESVSSIKADLAKIDIDPAEFKRLKEKVEAMQPTIGLIVIETGQIVQKVESFRPKSKIEQSGSINAKGYRARVTLMIDNGKKGIPVKHARVIAYQQLNDGEPKEIDAGMTDEAGEINFQIQKADFPRGSYVYFAFPGNETVLPSKTATRKLK